MAGMTDNEIYALVRRGMGAARSEGRAEGGQARAKRRDFGSYEVDVADDGSITVMADPVEVRGKLEAAGVKVRGKVLKDGGIKFPPRALAAIRGALSGDSNQVSLKGEVLG